MGLRALARAVVPFPIRAEWVRLRRWPTWRAERGAMARRKTAAAEHLAFTLAQHSSPLRRKDVVDERLQTGKEQNVRLVARLLDRISIAPGQVFSYHHAVGRPLRVRGFRPGPELQGGEMQDGIGGGACQVSNLLYLLAICAGMEIVERHRHALDLFPDHGRTVPFGCGATVYYNSCDLRFKNPFDFPVTLALMVDAGQLRGQILTDREPPFRSEIYEVGHHFEQNGDRWWRENWIRRRLVDSEGNVVRDEEIAHNRGQCLYDPGAQDD